MRPVEGVNETFTVRVPGPARGLNGSRNFQRQLAEPVIGRRSIYPALANEPPKVAVSRNVVESVVVHSHVREMGSHSLQRRVASALQESLFASGIELQQSRAVLKTLGPFGPATRGVFALDGVDGGSSIWLRRVLEINDFGGRKLEQSFEFGGERGGC